jgi:hypothetical protein
MRNQRAIDQFTLAFHERAVARLRENSELLGRARATLDRWRAQRGVTASDQYFERWQDLLGKGPDAVEQSVCTDTDAAAALRSVSPLGFVLSPQERMELHRLAEEA